MKRVLFFIVLMLAFSSMLAAYMPDQESILGTWMGGNSQICFSYDGKSYQFTEYFRGHVISRGRYSFNLPGVQRGVIIFLFFYDDNWNELKSFAITYYDNNVMQFYYNGYNTQLTRID